MSTSVHILSKLRYTTERGNLLLNCTCISLQHTKIGPDTKTKTSALCVCKKNLSFSVRARNVVNVLVLEKVSLYRDIVGVSSTFLTLMK